MKRTKVTRAVGTALGLAALATSLVACGSDDEGSGGGDGGGSDTITLGIIPSWTDGLSSAYLWKAILEEEGYEVEIEELSEAAPLYTGVAEGDIDVFPSAWPQVTHASYLEEYGDDLEDLGAYYEGAKLTFAVPEYSDLTSIADLKGAGDDYDGKIIGIEPGAGLTKVTKESVLPAYELEDEYTLVESSTTAMLTELKKATEAEDDIVVTLWKPFWANSEFPVRDLEDPEGALGEAETLNAIATAGFADENPELAEMFGNFKLDDAQYGSLENLVVNEYGDGKEEEAVEAWLEENPDFVDSLKG
ncbi:glycine betaine ABC transporter substrate-binding protein [Nocardioides pantholopis]|uniref:glycine betaine ABC transporter substrate-binding protein n=1 Tax=Nocardioides pantholopis TaxID=2483798 RepID=UPI000F082E99|nr:glycine betaine ABC transporter substrate-binding protein [Nocardioides pantholopis]